LRVVLMKPSEQPDSRIRSPRLLKNEPVLGFTLNTSVESRAFLAEVVRTLRHATFHASSPVIGLDGLTDDLHGLVGLRYRHGFLHF
jgi:hypothetical protein